MPNNSMQRTALRAAADADRCAPVVVAPAGDAEAAGPCGQAEAVPRGVVCIHAHGCGAGTGSRVANGCTVPASMPVAASAAAAPAPALAVATRGLTVAAVAA